MAWSAAAKVSRGSFHPPDPWLNDTVSYDSKGLVDDGVALEPLVGNRVFHSLACLDLTMIAIWGAKGSMSLRWPRKENRPALRSCGVSTDMNFDQQLIRVEGRKRMMGKHLLAARSA